MCPGGCPVRAARCPGSERGPRGRLLAPPRHGPPATWGQRPRRAGQRAAPPEQPGGRALARLAGAAPTPTRHVLGLASRRPPSLGTAAPGAHSGDAGRVRVTGAAAPAPVSPLSGWGRWPPRPPPPRGHFLRNRDPLKWPRPSSQLSGLGRAGLSPKVTSLSRADGPSVLGPPLSSRPLPGVVPALPGGPSVVALGSATASLLPPPAVPLT